VIFLFLPIIFGFFATSVLSSGKPPDKGDSSLPPETDAQPIEQIKDFVAYWLNVLPDDIQLTQKVNNEVTGVQVFLATCEGTTLAVKIRSKKLRQELVNNNRFVGEITQIPRIRYLDVGYYLLGEPTERETGFELRFYPILAFGRLLPNGEFLGPFEANDPEAIHIADNLLRTEGVTIEVLAWAPGVTGTRLLREIGDADGPELVHNQELLFTIATAFVETLEYFMENGLHHGDYALRNFLYAVEGIVAIIDAGPITNEDIIYTLDVLAACGLLKCRMLIPITARLLRLAVRHNLIDEEKYHRWFNKMFRAECLTGYGARDITEVIERLLPVRWPFPDPNTENPLQSLGFLEELPREESVELLVKCALLNPDLSLETWHSLQDQFPTYRKEISAITRSLRSAAATRPSVDELSELVSKSPKFKMESPPDDELIAPDDELIATADDYQELRPLDRWSHPRPAA
jgi:hypothetical protein